MYGDIYFKLTPEERKSLDAYNRRITSSSKAALITRRCKPAKDLSMTSEVCSPDSKLADTPKHRAEIKKTLASSSSSKIQGPKYRLMPNERFNVNYDIERFLRVLYRHAADCPKFRSDIEGIGGLGLLETQLNYKDIE